MLKSLIFFILRFEDIVLAAEIASLVYPDLDEAKANNFSADDIKNVMEQNRNGLNEMLPAYEKISEIIIRDQEFEKTPKKSIKRYLYQ